VIGPGDLIALVTFDGEDYPNLAVTRERLGGERHAHALGAALGHWLQRRHVWMEVGGRQIHGIATARQMARPDAWEIDTLVDAEPGRRVLRGLLQQAGEEAVSSGVARMLLRTPLDAPGEAEVRAAGFVPALHERLWRAPTLQGLASNGAEVREAVLADSYGRFQLHHRVLPLEARRAIALTHEEWIATREERWLDRVPARVALNDGHVVAELRVGSCEGGAQIDLLADDSGLDGARALLASAVEHCGERPVLALAPMGATTVELALADAGFDPGEEFVVWVRRLAKPLEETVREEARVRAGAVVPSGG
jgi:hypothetical protein